jgi:hypothetical protein
MTRNEAFTGRFSVFMTRIGLFTGRNGPFITRILFFITRDEYFTARSRATSPTVERQTELSSLA